MVAPDTEETAALLLAKHPTEAFSIEGPVPQRLCFSAEDVLGKIKKMPNGASPSFDGWTKELLFAAVSADENILELLADAVHLILARKLSPR